ncbi:MAG: 2OG-Fe(II) oxygenase [Woeseia sp.]
MKQLLGTVNNDLQTKAFARLDARRIFSDEQLQFLADASRSVPKELIRIGDVGEQNHLDVGRFMEDKKNELPVYRNDPVGKEVVNILNAGKSHELLTDLMKGAFYIRRCQVNVLHEGSFIGKHIDTYSNLDYLYSCVIQFGDSYEGGEFFVDYEGEEREIKTGYAEFLVNKCEIPHGVRTVQAGKRTSLVFFLSKNPLHIVNSHNKQI